MTRLLSLFRLADVVLRGQSAAVKARLTPGRFVVGPRSLAILVLIFGMYYGGVMGSYASAGLVRPRQMAYSAIKVPLLLLITFSLSLPSFVIINTLAGLRSDLPRVVRALLATQAGLTIVLASLSPLTLLWYVSGSAHEPAVLFNGLLFAVASAGGQWILRRDYAPLIRDNPRHRWMLRLWLVVYVFVGIQMGWVLRPFVGAPGMPVQFFRDDSWSNAYEVVLMMIWRAMTAGFVD
jgi:hypothetical protein